MLLNSVAEKAGTVATLPLSNLLSNSVLLRTLVLGVATGVLAAVVDGHPGLEAQAHGQKADEDTVALYEAWSVLWQVDEGGEDTAEVTESDVHSDTDTALDGAAHVVAIPGESLGDVGVDSAGEQEGSGVFGVVVVAGDLENETEDCYDGEAHHW